MHTTMVPDDFVCISAGTAARAKNSRRFSRCAALLMKETSPVMLRHFADEFVEPFTAANERWLEKNGSTFISSRSATLFV